MSETPTNTAPPHARPAQPRVWVAVAVAALIALVGLLVADLQHNEPAPPLGASASFGPKMLDTAALETRITAGIEQQAGVKIKSVECPGDVKVKKGNTFNCKATTNSGQTANVKVTQQDDKGNVNYQVGG